MVQTLISNRVVEEAGARNGVTFESVGVDALQPLPFDHAQIGAKGLERIRAKAAFPLFRPFSCRRGSRSRITGASSSS